MSGVGGRGDDAADHAAILEVVARSLRGGTSLVQALDEAAEALSACPAAVELAVAMARYRAGATVLDAIDAWTSAGVGAPRAVAGAALALGSEVGGARARALEGAASGLRDRAEVAREVRALTSQARTSALVMVSAPVAFAAYAWTTDRRVAALMWTTPLGWACLAVGLALDAVGAWWMARLTARVT